MGEEKSPMGIVRCRASSLFHKKESIQTGPSHDIYILGDYESGQFKFRPPHNRRMFYEFFLKLFFHGRSGPLVFFGHRTPGPWSQLDAVVGRGPTSGASADVLRDSAWRFI